MDRTQDFVGYDVVDADGRSVGSVQSLWVDGATREPEFVAVGGGSGGTTIAPLAGARADEGTRRLQLPYSADQITGAPQFDSGMDLDTEQEEQVYRHYGVQRSEDSSPTGLAGGMTGRQGQPTGGRTERTEGEQTLELREERLRVEKEREQAGEVRLGKRVEEHTEQVNVPLREERVVVERHPGTGRVTGEAIRDTGEEINVPVMKERATVEKEAVVREEVSARKETVEHTERVQDTVRREELVVEGEGDIVADGENLNAPRTPGYEREQGRRR